MECGDGGLHAVYAVLEVWGSRGSIRGNLTPGVGVQRWTGFWASFRRCRRGFIDELLAGRI